MWQPWQWGLEARLRRSRPQHQMSGWTTTKPWSTRLFRPNVSVWNRRQVWLGCDPFLEKLKRRYIVCCRSWKISREKLGSRNYEQTEAMREKRSPNNKLVGNCRVAEVATERYPGGGLCPCAGEDNLINRSRQDSESSSSCINISQFLEAQQ